MSGQTLIALITAATSLVASVVTAAVSSSFRRRSETELAKLETGLRRSKASALRGAPTFMTRASGCTSNFSRCCFR
jgi:hypothetical protein